MNDQNLIKIERMHFLDGEGPTRAFCDLLLFDVFIVKGFRIVEGKENLFISMPSEKGNDEKWYETFFPVSKEIRKEMENLVLEEYKEQKSNYDNREK